MYNVLLLGTVCSSPFLIRSENVSDGDGDRNEIEQLRLNIMCDLHTFIKRILSVE